MLSTNPIGYLRKMEEVLRTAEQKNRLTGLYIEIESSTVSAWCAFLREMIEAAEGGLEREMTEQLPIAAALPKET